MNEIIQRVDAELKSRGWSRADLARKLGYSEQRLMNWWKRGLPASEHARIAEVLGWTVDRLITGRAEPDRGPFDGTDENHTQYGVEIASEWTTAKVAVMDQRFSAGQGAHEDHEEDFVSGYEEISQALLEKEQIQPGRAKIIKVDGDSMYPTLWDKDEVLSDTNVPHLVSDSIYAFEFDGRLLVKRFTKKLDGSWLISSDNKDDPSLKDEIVSHHNAQQLRIIARCKRVIGRSL